MKRITRDELGRFAKTRWESFLELKFRPKVIGVAVLLGCITNALLASYLDHGGHFDPPSIKPVEVAEAKEEPKEVLIRINYDWTKEKIEQEIRKTFPETPGIAVAVARCESGLNIEITGPTSDEGLFQIHRPTWHQRAIELGLEDYATNPHHNLKMARHVYEQQGWNGWVCFNQGYYQKYL